MDIIFETFAKLARFLVKNLKFNHSPSFLICKIFSTGATFFQVFSGFHYFYGVFWFPPRGRVFVFYLIFVPGGVSSSGVISMGFPFWSAASIIPLDSSPMNSFGSRLTSTTTFLPVRSSGVRCSAMPATICLVCPFPISTSMRRSFFVVGTFSAFIIFPTRKSIFWNSLKVIVGIFSLPVSVFYSQFDFLGVWLGVVFWLLY